jgi:hypothetical protein
MRPRLPPLNALKAFKAAARHESLPKIVTFRDWLLVEAAKDMRRLKTIGSPSKPLK